jgi:hypothetical protein
MVIKGFRAVPLTEAIIQKDISKALLGIQRSMVNDEIESKVGTFRSLPERGLTKEDILAKIAMSSLL